MSVGAVFFTVKLILTRFFGFFEFFYPAKSEICVRKKGREKMKMEGKKKEWKK
jgi:hypothetical protein